MKLHCKGCQKKIKLADYKCPFCGTVNFSTDEEVRAAYNARVPKHVPGKAGAAVAGALVAVNLAVVILIIIISVIIGAIIISIKADNDWAFEHVLQQTDFDNANSGFGNRFELTRVYSESTYPYYVMYITYNGEPENFISESVALCDMMYCSYSPEERRNNYRDELSIRLTCGEMKLALNQSRYAKTNVLFDYSELEVFGLKSLTVYTDGMTDEEKQQLDGASYPFELIIKLTNGSPL